LSFYHSLHFTFAFGLYKGHYTYPMVAQFSTGILAQFSISIYIYMIYYKSVAPERESCRNNTLISGYISDVHCIVNRINRWSDLLHRLFSY
jgi:hypothetical protein